MREIERSSFFGSVTCFTIGKGVTPAIFRIEGSFCPLYEAFKMFRTGVTKISAYSFNTQLERLSGPGASCLIR